MNDNFGNFTAKFNNNCGSNCKDDYIIENSLKGSLENLLCICFLAS